MSRQSSPPAVFLLILSVLAAGCRPQQPFYFQEDGDLSHYVGVATNIDYPDVDVQSLGEVTGAQPPLTLDNPKPKQMWDLPLHEAMRIALENSKVIRNLGGVSFGPSGSAGDPSTLLTQPSLIPSVYDPARVESDPRYGVEGVLSAFDAQFNASVLWQKATTPQNRFSTPSLFGPSVTVQDLGTFQAQLSKTTVTGGTFALTHDVGYEWNNSPVYPTSPFGKLWPSDWTTDFVAQFSQPLLQGAGAQFNRIAGPGSIPGFYNGVMIARLRTDVALTEFEASVRDLTRDVERAYWELYYAYRVLDTAIVGRDQALQTWRQVYAKYQVGGRGGAAQDEAQARQQYYLFLSTVQQASSNLYRTENVLRYIIGLAATDGRLIRPADEPTTAKVSFDWYEIHAEALTRTVELRQQKWVIKQRELELIAAKNFLMPRLDAVGQYKWSGLGDTLIDPSNNRSNAYGSLTHGGYEGWQVGLELNIPIGFRQPLAAVRNAEWNLARDRSVAQEQELELSNDLASAVRDLSDKYVIAATNFNRRSAAVNEVDAIQAAYDQGTVTLDLVLLAQQRLAEAESQYYRALVDYNEAIMNVHYRKGSLLEYDGVYLSEGPWPGKAYFDALRLARSRDASYYLNYGFTRPKVISRGPINQDAAAAGMPDADVVPQPVEPEAIPAPAPQPIPSGEVAPPAGLQPEMGSQTAVPPTASAKVAASAGNTQVRPVSYQASAGTASSAASAGWKSTTASTRHEPVANSTPADADRTASGWKRVQR